MSISPSDNIANPLHFIQKMPNKRCLGVKGSKTRYTKALRETSKIKLNTRYVDPKDRDREIVVKKRVKPTFLEKHPAVKVKKEAPKKTSFSLNTILDHPTTIPDRMRNPLAYFPGSPVELEFASNVDVEDISDEEVMRVVDQTLEGRMDGMKFVKIPEFGSKQFGLKATRDIRKGTLVAFYGGKIEPYNRALVDNHYFFNFGKKKNTKSKEFVINGMLCKSPASLGGCMNQAMPADKAQVELRVCRLSDSALDTLRTKMPGKKICPYQLAYFAEKNIKKGHGILMDYGQAYWKDCNIKPVEHTPESYLQRG